MAKSPAWTRKEGKNPKGGLNAKGRAFREKAGDEPKAATARGWIPQGFFLCQNEGHEKEAHK